MSRDADDGCLSCTRLSMQELNDLIDTRMEANLVQHCALSHQAFDVHFEEIKAMLLVAFPGGDASRHREYHEEQIVWMRERREFWKSLREKTALGAAWTILGFVGTLVWEAARERIWPALRDFAAPLWRS